MGTVLKPQDLNFDENAQQELVKGSADVITTLIGSLGSRQKTEAEQLIKKTCGRRPLLKKNRAKYETCANNVLKQFAPKETTDNKQQYIPDTTPKGGMSKGLKTGLIIGGAVVGLAVIGFIIYKFKK